MHLNKTLCIFFYILHTAQVLRPQYVVVSGYCACRATPLDLSHSWLLSCIPCVYEYSKRRIRLWLRRILADSMIQDVALEPHHARHCALLAVLVTCLKLPALLQSRECTVTCRCSRGARRESKSFVLVRHTRASAGCREYTVTCTALAVDQAETISARCARQGTVAY